MICLPDRLIVRSRARVGAVSHDTAVTRERRRIVQHRALDGVAHVGEIVELRDQRADERGLQLGEQRAQPGDDRHGLLQAEEVARAGGSERDAGDQAIEILDRFQDLAELAPVRGPKRQVFDGVEPIADRFDRHERSEQPSAEQTAAD